VPFSAGDFHEALVNMITFRRSIYIWGIAILVVFVATMSICMAYFLSPAIMPHTGMGLHSIRSYADQCSNPSVPPKCTKTQKILFAGLIRNGESKVQHMKTFFAAVGEMFQTYHVLVVENDSTDGVRQKLTDWQLESPDNVTILGCGINVERCIIGTEHYLNHEDVRTRIVNLASARNVYLEHMRTHFSHYDYIMICDLDLCAHLSLEGLHTAMELLSSNNSYNAITANSRRSLYRRGPLLEYYDTFAYLPLGREIGFTDNASKRQWDKDGKLHARHGISDDPYEVASGFGGCTIYKVKALLNPTITYHAGKENRYGCEHVYFNEHISGIYFVPAMLFEIGKN
jgi:hypothetical protein